MTDAHLIIKQSKLGCLCTFPKFKATKNDEFICFNTLHLTYLYFIFPFVKSIVSYC